METNGLYGLGIYSPDYYLPLLTSKPVDLSFDMEIPRKFHFFFGISLFKTLISAYNWKDTSIIVSSDIETLSEYNFTPIDYTRIYTLKPCIEIKPQKTLLKRNQSSIERIVSKNSQNDFMSSYINLISYVPAKNRQKLKSIIINYLFKSSSIEETLGLLKKSLDSSLVTDRFIYQFEQDGPAYRKAILSNVMDKVDPYVISFFRSEYGKTSSK